MAAPGFALQPMSIGDILDLTGRLDQRVFLHTLGHVCAREVTRPFLWCQGTLLLPPPASCREGECPRPEGAPPKRCPSAPA